MFIRRMCRAVPMMLLRTSVLEAYGADASGGRTSWTPEGILDKRRRTGISHQASEQRTKTASAQGAGGASLSARRLVDLTRKSEFEAT
ncbi:hypothetical protein CCMA1212_006382 [Trichoderma ghanense]|uniref:Secreted protein n=1 Tax=Trichoderma ghanense TaxID=65468 RepID=A0ABY2H1C4_9HYPO